MFIPHFEVILLSCVFLKNNENDSVKNNNKKRIQISFISLILLCYA